MTALAVGATDAYAVFTADGLDEELLPDQRSPR